MLAYCLVCKKNTKNKDAKMMKTENGRIMLPSKCAICGNKKSSFVKEQEASGILTELGIRTLLLGDLLIVYKTNEIVNKFLLVGDKFLPEMHLR